MLQRVVGITRVPEGQRQGHGQGYSLVGLFIQFFFNIYFVCEVQNIKQILYATTKQNSAHISTNPHNVLS